jgi:hypothetical protein
VSAKTRQDSKAVFINVEALYRFNALSTVLSTPGKISALFERTSDDAIFSIYLALSASDQVGIK